MGVRSLLPASLKPVQVGLKGQLDLTKVEAEGSALLLRWRIPGGSCLPAAQEGEGQEGGGGQESQGGHRGLQREVQLCVQV